MGIDEIWIFRIVPVQNLEFILRNGQLLVSGEQYRNTKAIKNITQEIRLLKEYEIALISEVVSGQVDVKEEAVESLNYNLLI